MKGDGSAFSQRSEALGGRGQRLMDLYFMSVGPVDSVMDIALRLLGYISDQKLVKPGLFPNMDDVGGLSMEWAIRVDNGDFDLVNVEIGRSCCISTSYLPAGGFSADCREHVTMKAAEGFILSRVPVDDRPYDDGY